MAKIFMVDDEPLLMESLEIILTYSGGHYICGFSFNGVDALEKLDKKTPDQLPDVMLVDLNMPQMGGIELIRKVKAKYPDIKIIVLTTFYDEKNISPCNFLIVKSSFQILFSLSLMLLLHT